MYILAIKSLLAYVSGLAVVVHSDGSLTDHDFSHIANHVQGTHFVGHEAADERAR
jgi:hypothetical protein